MLNITYLLFIKNKYIILITKKVVRPIVNNRKTFSTERLVQKRKQGVRKSDRFSVNGFVFFPKTLNMSAK